MPMHIKARVKPSEPGKISVWLWVCGDSIRASRATATAYPPKDVDEAIRSFSKRYKEWEFEAVMDES